MTNQTEDMKENPDDDKPDIVILNTPDSFLMAITIISISALIASLIFIVYMKIQQNSRIESDESDYGSNSKVMVTPAEDIPIVEERYTRERLCTPPRPMSGQTRLTVQEVINQNDINLLRAKHPHLLRPPVYAIQFCHKSSHQSNRYLPDVQ